MRLIFSTYNPSCGSHISSIDVANELFDQWYPSTATSMEKACDPQAGLYVEK